jgi:hypothetical protein
MRAANGVRAAVIPADVCQRHPESGERGFCGHATRFGRITLIRLFAIQIRITDYRIHHPHHQYNNYIYPT